MSQAHQLGVSGEEAAVRYLEKKRFKIVTRGFRFHRGEIDVIAYDKDTLVFIEVKTRRNLEGGLPEEAVTPAKQAQIRKIAEAYLAMNRIGDVPCRFDVMSLLNEPGRGFAVRHIRDAF
jgi:putative endonuclease